MTDPQAQLKLKDAIQAFPPDKRRQEFDNALNQIEMEERNKKLNEWFASLPPEVKDALYRNH
jgi:hypothetical protein